MVKILRKFNRVACTRIVYCHVQRVGTVDYIVEVHTPLQGLKKIYVIPKDKTNFLKKIPAGNPPIFFYKFLKFQHPHPHPSTPKPWKKNWKNSHVYICSQIILCENNLMIFEPFLLKVRVFKFLLFTIILFCIGRGRGGSGQNFFRKVLHQYPHFGWVSAQSEKVRISPSYAERLCIVYTFQR